ncbi:zeta toxin family protein [Chitinophagaceae bacterium 26-R-25]|nr:zeta toxin family protein [Chitinophagaceae bacterium 26-R-25]
MEEKNLYIIAGCNGAGKTTASFTILPEMLNIKEFVNADEIAKGLSPFNQEGVALEAGRIMLHRINELLTENKSFAFETTLSTKSYKNKIREAKERGYGVVLLFFYLDSVELAKQRVKTRVSEGGHNIEPDVIERRYIGGIRNLFDIYIEIVDRAFIFDNSNGEPELIIKRIATGEVEIADYTKFDTLKFFYEKHK